MIAAIFTLLSLSFAQGPEQTFVRPCYVAGDDDMLTSQIQITDKTWTVTHTAYVDEQCKGTYLIFETKSKVRQENDNIDLTTLEVSYVSTRNDVTRALNEIVFCGKQDWVTNQKQIVTGDQCQDFAAPALGQVIYSIFKTETVNGQTSALIGSPTLNADGSTSEKRHTEYEGHPYYLVP